MQVASPEMEAAINNCYNSLVDQSDWAGALHAVAGAADADAACLYAEGAADLRLRFPASPRYQHFLEDFIAGDWWRTDHRAARGWPRLRGGNRVLVEHDLVTDEERKTFPVYHDLYARHDLTWWAAVSFRVDDQDWAMPLLRREGQGPFGKEARSLLSVGPHLARIVGIGSAMMESGARDAVSLFEAGHRAAIGIDWLGRCMALNARAEALLGRDLFVAKQRLRAADGQADRQLQIFLHSALKAKRMVDLPPSISIRRDNGMPVVIDAIATPDAMGSTRLKLQLVLLLTDLALVPRLAAEKLMRVFGFTPAEARLAEQLSEGHSLAEAAERLQVSLETARSQLKAVFARTDTHRQADLLRLLDRAAQAAGRT